MWVVFPPGICSGGGLRSDCFSVSSVVLPGVGISPGFGQYISCPVKEGSVELGRSTAVTHQRLEQGHVPAPSVGVVPRSESYQTAITFKEGSACRVS